MKEHSKPPTKCSFGAPFHSCTSRSLQFSIDARISTQRLSSFPLSSKHARLSDFSDSHWQNGLPTPLPFYTQLSDLFVCCHFKHVIQEVDTVLLVLIFNYATWILLFHRRVNEFATLNPESWLLSQYPILYS